MQSINQVLLILNGLSTDAERTGRDGLEFKIWRRVPESVGGHDGWEHRFGSHGAHSTTESGNRMRVIHYLSW
jgi:hypothetical protein